MGERELERKKGKKRRERTRERERERQRSGDGEGKEEEGGSLTACRQKGLDGERQSEWGTADKARAPPPVTWHSCRPLLCLSAIKFHVQMSPPSQNAPPRLVCHPQGIPATGFLPNRGACWGGSDSASSGSLDMLASLWGWGIEWSEVSWPCKGVPRPSLLFSQLSWLARRGNRASGRGT